MSFTAKTFIKFLLALCVFTASFGIIFSSFGLGILIGLFLSISLVYDPKIYAKAKEKYNTKHKESNKH